MKDGERIAEGDVTIDDMDEALAEVEEIEPVAVEGTPAPEAGPVVPAAVEPMVAETAPEPPLAAETGFPNPLGLELTGCHLPQEFIENKKKLLKYTGRHLTTPQIVNLSPSPNEVGLYGKYKQLVRMRGEARPVSLRAFSATVRLIVRGKPLEPPVDDPLDEMAV